MKLADELRRIQINPHSFYGEEPHLYHYSSAPREMRGTAWVVTRRGERLSERYVDDGNKRFPHSGRESSEPGKHALAAAQTWASERFGVEAWTKDPWGGYGSAAFVERRLAELRPQLDALPPAPLPVFTWRSSVRDFGQTTMLCAAKTKASAARAAGGVQDTRDMGVTGNAADCALARSQPGVVFFQRTSRSGEPWRYLTSEQPVEQ